MTEIVVHVTTLEQWQSVLNVWFNQGYTWMNGSSEYKIERFLNDKSRLLGLSVDGDDGISYWSNNDYNGGNLIEYSDFMAQQKGESEVTTYYVTQTVFDELQKVKAHEGTSLIESIAQSSKLIKSIKVGNKAILRYLADDPAIEFEAKEELYRLWAIDDYGDKVYFAKKDSIWTRSTVSLIEKAFTAPLDEIKKWQTPAWEIELA